MSLARHVFTLDFSADDDESLKGRKTAPLSCVVFRDFYLAFSAVTRGRLLRVPAVSCEFIFHERCAEGLSDGLCAQTTACCTRCISPALLTDGLDAWCDAVEVVAFASELSSGGVA